MLQIVGLSHIKIHVSDIKASIEFYRDTLGLIVSYQDETRALLKGFEEGHQFSLFLEKSSETGIDHFSFKVTSEKDLKEIEEICMKNGLTLKKFEETGIKECIRIQDPGGFPVEFSYGIERGRFYHQDFRNMKGAFPIKLDHITLHTPLLEQVAKFYKEDLGFIETEEIQRNHKELVAIFLTKSGSTHDIAFFKGSGPSMHHFAIRVRDIADIIRVCDILGSQGLVDQIEFGPGRHRATNGLFVYTRDPDGNRVELFTGDYRIDGPDWKPIVWQEEPRRIELWGRLPPPTFRNEKSKVFNIVSGKPVEYLKFEGDNPISL